MEGESRGEIATSRGVEGGLSRIIERLEGGDVGGRWGGGGGGGRRGRGSRHSEIWVGSKRERRNKRAKGGDREEGGKEGERERGREGEKEGG